MRILRWSQKRGITRTLQAMIHRRSDIESAISHMKRNGRLGSNPLKGTLDDALHAALCGADHNWRLILPKLQLLAAQFTITLPTLMAMLSAPVDRTQLAQDWETGSFMTD